jgi:hypothetical protein
LAALGLASSGYLSGREDVAACGAVMGALGVAVERYQSRAVRLRLRRERACYRDDLRRFSRDLHDVQRQLTGLRADLDDVRSERDTVREQLYATLREQMRARNVPEEPREAGVADVSEPAASPALQAPDDVQAPTEVPAGAEVPEGAEPHESPVTAAALGLLVPGQLRSPLATGGIRLVPPGPAAPVRVIDLSAADQRPPLLPRAHGAPQLAPAADALVYAALAEAEADELTRMLEVPGERASLHTGHAHRAGDFARDDDDAQAAAPPVLYVVSRHRRVA